MVCSGLSVIQALLLIIGGVWTFFALVLRRELAARVELSIDVPFIGVHKNYWLAEVVAYVDNKGLRRHKVVDFSFWVRYMTDRDSITYGDESINYQVVFPQEIENVCYKVQAEIKEKRRSWVHPKAEYTYVEPGIRQRYSYVIAIPCDAKFVLVHGSFEYKRGRISTFFTAGRFFATQDKLVQVPE
jgi:hypothetical protein